MSNLTQQEVNFLNKRVVKSNLKLAEFNKKSKSATNYKIEAMKRTIAEYRLVAQGCDWLQSKEGKALRKECGVFETKVEYGQKLYGIGQSMISRVHKFGNLEQSFFDAYLEFGETCPRRFTLDIKQILKVYVVLENDGDNYSAELICDVFKAWETKDEEEPTQEPSEEPSEEGEGEESESNEEMATLFSLKANGEWFIHDSVDNKEMAERLMKIAKQIQF